MLKRKDSKGLGDKYYTDDIVDQHSGTYFRIDFTDIYAKEVIYFNTGKYVIDDFDKYNKALEEFQVKVNEKLNTSSFHDDYRIFVKGKADLLGNETFRAPLDSRYAFREICYLPKYRGTEYLFSKEEICPPVPDIIANKDLPNLRANFLKEKFNARDLNWSAQILDGSVVDVISENERNGTILLYLSKNILGD